jgi:putative flippase GtrA
LKIAAASDSRRFIRFLIAGGLNTLFGFAVYSTAILIGAPVWAGLLIANLTGIVFNFVTTGGYAFRSRVLSRFPRFACAYLIIFLVNWALIRGLAVWFADAILAQAILTVPMALLSYVIMARWVFAPGPETAPSP